MITKHTYTHTYDRDGQRIRDDIMQWRLFGLLPLLTQRREVWSRAALISDELRAAVLTADSYQCVYCGATERAVLAVDHLLPQSQGGCSTVENLRTACKSCNSAKGGRTPEEANMPLFYGRYLQAAPLEQPRISMETSPAAVEVQRLFFTEKLSITEIVFQLRQVRGNQGAKYQQALAEVQDLLRQGMAH